MTLPGEARELFSKSEWAFLESSLAPSVEALPAPDLKSRIRRAKKLVQHSEDLLHAHHSESRKRRTRRKIDLISEAVGRFEGALKSLESAESGMPASKNPDSEKIAGEMQKLNLISLQDRADHEIERRKKHALSAIAVRGEQQGGKSGSRRIQSHIGSATRRQQGRRDSKNR